MSGTFCPMSYADASVKHEMKIHSHRRVIDSWGYKCRFVLTPYSRTMLPSGGSAPCTPPRSCSCAAAVVTPPWSSSCPAAVVRVPGLHSTRLIVNSTFETFGSSMMSNGTMSGCSSGPHECIDMSGCSSGPPYGTMSGCSSGPLIALFDSNKVGYSS